MADKTNAKQRSSFLSRLLRDEAGNTIAIMAAAVIPVLGLVGGAVDMGRIYLVKTRLQAACDAGSLMGRKVMGASTWNSTANDRAHQIFDMNFQAGSYGSTGLAYSFSESGGDVVGTATAAVPVTLMRPVMLNSEARNYVDNLEQTQNRKISPNERQQIYKNLDASSTGQSRDKVITVDCNAELRIPNTDVMFVLDTTGSMSQAASSSSSESKISGLRKATKCFYEAIAKLNIDDVTPADCGRTTDPSSGTGTDVQLRFGFVPYSVNANVGKLLPLDYIADSWTYQSREATWTNDTGYRSVYGTESSYTPYGSPTTVSGSGGWSSWQDAASSVTIGGTTYSNNVRANSSQCAALVAPSRQTVSSVGRYNFVSQNPNPLTYPTASLTRTYSRDTVNGETEYQYYYAGNNRCRLSYHDRTTSTVTNYFQTTTPITWIPNRQFDGWDYKPVTFNISGLKNTGSNAWNNSVTLPLGTQGADMTANWAGCVEERQTQRVNAADPTGAWDPIPTNAYDMQIDLVPTSQQTRWGPILSNTVYQRYRNGGRTTTLVESNGSGNWLNNGSASVASAYCPTAAKKYQAWTPSAFKSYVNSLAVGGNTYHDIGLLWGARLMSPQGIFSAENALPNLVVDRNLIFMTDGETNTQIDDYSAYGINWWDRRQNDGSDPTKTWLDSNLDERTLAICKAVRDKNISVWVITFGSDIPAATETHLQQCASSGKYFHATSVADIVNQFNAIAAQISALRLTN